MKDVKLQFQLIATALKSLHSKLTCFKLKADCHTSVVWDRAGVFSILIWDLYKTNSQKYQGCDGISPTISY